MRRMYSKEQLQKLIDEVSRLIAVEELDKVVPVPTLADAGKVMVVNATGTGYQLASGLPLLMENIEDEDGHKRFIDFDFTPSPLEGVTYTYSKASLSGTHLLIVMAGTVLAGSGQVSAGIMAFVDLPEWIRNKIYPAYSAYIGAFNGQIITEETYATENLTFGMDKIATGVRIDLTTSITKSAVYQRYFRVCIDLLIDNE